MPDDGLPDAEPVGYRRPPRHSRFAPGRSGNPAGRVKGSRNLSTLLTAELQRPMTVTEGGRSRRVPKAAVLVAVQINKALKGDTRAFNTVLQATRRPAGADGGADGGGADGGGADGAAAIETARERLRELFDRHARQRDEERHRLAAALAAAGLPEAQLDLLFGPRGERLRPAVTAALAAAQALSFDPRRVAGLSLHAAVAEECADALPGEAGDG